MITSGLVKKYAFHHIKRDEVGGEGKRPNVVFVQSISSACGPKARGD